MLQGCILLAGGAAKRLRPVSLEIPKALIPIRGKPLIEHVIDHVIGCGIRKIIIAAGYMSEQIERYFSIKKFPGVQLTIYIEGEPLDTGGAIRTIAEIAEQRDHFKPPAWLVMNGDNLIDVDVQKVYETHRKNEKLVTMCIKGVEDTADYGIVLGGVINNISAFKEKTGERMAGYINAGWYIFDSAVLNLLPEEPRKFSLERELFPQLAEKGQLGAYDLGSAYWNDVGTFSRWEEAIKTWKTGGN